MLRALKRMFRGIWLLLVGKADSTADSLGRNPQVVRAQYDEVIREKGRRIQAYQKAVAGLIAQQEQKMAKVRTLSEEVEKLEKLKAGALAKAKQTVEKLQAAGASKEAIHRDEDYQRCLNAFHDFSSTLQEKQARIEEMEADVKDYGKRIGEHKVMLEELMREIDKLRAESHDAVAVVISAKEEKAIADTWAGIARDSPADELRRLRDMRQQVKAEARIAKEMAGTDAKAQEAEFLEYARESSGNDEFDALIGLAEEKDAPARAPTPREAAGESKLPE